MLTHYNAPGDKRMTDIMKILSSDPPRMENITLLAVSPDQNDHYSLQHILGSKRWTVHAARSCHEAEAALQHDHPAVIACESDLPDGSWKDLLNLLLRLENPPPIVVVSRHADESLWAEVLNLGGYDVLAKPLESDEVERVLTMARRYGRGHRSAQVG
jgi:DNA-binding NtrC family response regulator